MGDWKRASNRTKAATLDFYGIPHGIKAGKRRQPTGEPVEADVIRAVSELLAVHPKVWVGIRANSGAASFENATGRYSPVFFYRIVRGHEYLKQPTTIPDFWGLLVDGRPFCLEAKRPGFKFHFSDDRARRQHAFIEMVKKVGGIGGFVTSADEAKEILDGSV